MSRRKLLKGFVPKRVSARPAAATVELRLALQRAAADLEAVDQAIAAAQHQRGALRRAFRALQKAEQALGEVARG